MLSCAPTQAIFRSHVLMLRSGAERLPVVRNKQVYRVAVLSFVTLIVAALVSAPLYQRSTSQHQPEPAHGAQEPSRTRITLCTQVLNEVSSVAASREHMKPHSTQSWSAPFARQTNYPAFASADTLPPGMDRVLPDARCGAEGPRPQTHARTFPTSHGAACPSASR